MCRVCYGPSLSCAEFAMCRVVPKSFEAFFKLFLLLFVLCLYVIF